MLMPVGISYYDKAFICHRYSSITDQELDVLVTRIQHHHPRCGYRLMIGHLISLGHRVQETRVRRSMLRTDPEGVISRLGLVVYYRIVRLLCIKRTFFIKRMLHC
jgi:hypothetical protein